MSLDIAVLMGGYSAERAVSLVSGEAAARALEGAGHAVRRIDVGRDLKALMAALEPKPDLCFNALHGTGGEDGQIQAVLDWLEIPYTHSGRVASTLAMDKPLAKKLAAQAGLKVADEVLAPVSRLKAERLMAPPLVVKPPAEGSSVGVRLVLDEAQFAALEPEEGDPVMLVERYIPGRELTVAVLSAGAEAPKALAVTEIAPRAGFYDYTAKYTDGKADHYCPAQIPDDLAATVMEQAEAAHRALGCRGLSRCDFRYDPAEGGAQGLYFLEINTQPGMTPLSLAPEQAASRGMSFSDLVLWMVEAARR